MIAINRRRLLVASAVLATGGLVLSSVPAQAVSLHREVGVTSSSIKLGITIPMTGAASPGYNKVPSAMKAYFDYVNANGGVNGRKITLVVKDDQYVPGVAVAKTNELILKDKVFALLAPLGTANVKAVAASVNPGRRGIPTLFTVDLQTRRHTPRPSRCFLPTLSKPRSWRSTYPKPTQARRSGCSTKMMISAMTLLQALSKPDSHLL
jgi:hypothetical protein